MKNIMTICMFTLFLTSCSSTKMIINEKKEVTIRKSYLQKLEDRLMLKRQNENSLAKQD